MMRPEAILGSRIRERRHALGLSQEAFAHRCNLHWTYVGRVERGQSNITVRNLLKMAKGLDVDPGELVNGL